jgi:glycosyltransferase involved in cell wall biosynthesis
VSERPPARSLTLVVLTFNEARNIEACLESAAPWVDETFVVDSGSTDATVAMASRLGAHVVAHPFETHSRQWRWAMDHLPIRTDWVLALDADQRLTPELGREIVDRIGAGTPADGFFLNRRQVFRGRWIRHGGYYPKYLLKCFRRGVVSIDERELVDHHFAVAGPVERLGHDLIEDNRNEAEIFNWTAKHNRYAVLQARQEIAQAGTASGQPAIHPASPDAAVRRDRAFWANLPLFVRPVLYVFYRYVVRLGFLDGKEGFIFHVLQGFWYRLLVDINIDELRRAGRAPHQGR